MAYQWNAGTASFRLPVNVDDNGDISTGGTVAGTRGIVFGYVDNTATLMQIVDGGGTPDPNAYKGLGGVFINYLFNGSFVLNGAKKTVTYSAEEVA